MITRALLVIALLGCLALAQYGPTGNLCLCRRTREAFGNPRNIQDVQIFHPSYTCDKMEIIVLQKNGLRYCLDPKVKKVQELIRRLQGEGSGGSSGSGGSMGQSRPRGNCLCRRTRIGFGDPKAIQDILIYPPSHSCDIMEIVVVQKNGLEYCLDPKVKKVQELIRHLQNKESAPVAVPAKDSGTPRPPEDVQIYPTSRPCDKFEILVTNKNWKQDCLDPRGMKLEEVIRRLQSEESAPVAVPAKDSGTPRPPEDIQIYPTSRPCDKFEILVTNRNEKQDCLDPRGMKLEEVIKRLQSE